MAKAYVSLERERRRLQLIFVLPLMLSIVTLVAVPIASLVGISFTSLNFGKKGLSFLGFDNYAGLVNDPNFINAFVNTVIMLAGTVGLQMALGIVIALIIHKTSFMQGTIRTVILFPMIIPPIIVGIMWRVLLLPKYGSFNVMLAELGFKNVPDWLSSPALAMMTIILVAVWEWTPFVVLFVLAGLEGQPASPYEAIKIDGANWWQEIRYLTLPLLKPILGIVVMFRIVESLKIFPLVFSLTEGGPGSSTVDFAYYVYKEGFSYLRLGYASAAAMLVFAILLLAIYFAIRIGSRRKKGVGA